MRLKFGKVGAVVARFVVLAMAILSASSAHASLIAVLGNNANDADGLAFVNNVLGITDPLTLLAKEDVGGGFTGSISPADWNLTLGSEDRSGTWTIDDPTVVPSFFFVKFDGLLAIYSVMDADGLSPWSDSYDLDAQIGTDPTLLVPILDNDGNVLFPAGSYPGFPPPNPWAATSHLSVYSIPNQVPEPASLFLLGTGILALGWVGRRRSS